MMVWLARLKAWLKWTLCDLFYRCVPRRSPKEGNQATGVNLIGYANAEMGLGEALRNTALALKDASVPFLVRKLDVQLLNRQQNRSLDPYISDRCAFGINMIGISPDLLYRIAGWLQYDEWSGPYNIGYWFWELPNFPAQWRYATRLVDEVWVSTDFVAGSVQQVHDRVYKIPFAVAFDEPAAAYDRRYFGLPETGTLFLFSYDLNSSTARKNPGDVVKAFRQAFPNGDEPVVLVVKLINGEQAPAALGALKASLHNDARICLIDHYLTTDEMRGLLRTADCYVSLHRSEGLGLGMAESMFLGKPVIATAYSGNMEFMNPNNALLVPYTLVQVAEGDYPFAGGQQWAAPDKSVAADYMRLVVNDPAQIARIGAAARSYMQTHHSIKVMSEAIARRLESINQRLQGATC